ncbi:MAG: PQQ-binding-like beta-propeller repeat protein, partial [Verrucomicrobiae bacterium]|nr:PQQ-binding-like beta-propeller repeat protein [Verrucomicrobiae bacterium]
MYSPERNLPARFDPGKFKQGSDEVDLSTAVNLRWVAKLGSQAYGNAVVASGKVLIGTNNDNPRDPQHQGDRSILLCLSEEDGSFLWQLVIPKLKEGKANDWDGIGLLSSPAVEGNRVYLVTTRCEVVCLDLNGMADGNDGPFTNEAEYVVADTGAPPATIGPHDGDIIWLYNMMDELGVFPHNAANSSPLVVGDLVYTCTSNGHDWTHSNVPSPFSPSFIALCKNRGVLAAEDDANIGPRILHGQWSSVTAAVLDGKPFLFCAGGDGFLYALDALPSRKAGKAVLRTIWWYDCNPHEYRFNKDGTPARYPAPNGPSEIVATPVFYNNRVYVATGQDPEHGDGAGCLVCVKASGQGNVTSTATVWSFRKIRRSLSTVSIDPDSGLLFVADLAGYVYCLDAATGDLFWTHDMKAHVWGSTLVAGDRVFVADEDGDLTVLSAAKEKNVLFEVNLGAPAYSTPVAANGTVY